MTDRTFSSDQKHREAIELLVKMMVNKDLIKTNNLDGLVDTVKKVLASVEGADKESFFTNPANMKKLMSLVICANIENQCADSPQLSNIFNSKKLAEALFEPKNTLKEKEEAKKTVSIFLLALMPMPKGKGIDEADKMTEELLNDGDLDATKQEMLQEHFSNYMDIMQNQARMAEEYKQMEYNYALAFGDSPDGTPILITSQGSNAQGFIDTVVLTPTGNAGYLNEELKNLENSYAPELARTGLVSKSSIPTLTR